MLRMVIRLFSDVIVLVLFCIYCCGLQLRNTARFALGNLYDFVPRCHLVPVSDLPEAEQFILHRLTMTSIDIAEAYDEYNFAKVQSLLMQVSLLRVKLEVLVTDHADCSWSYSWQQRISPRFISTW